MNSRLILLIVVALVIPLTLSAKEVPLHSLDLSHMSQSYGKPQVNRSIMETSMTVAGRVFDYGVGTHASSLLRVKLDGGSVRFRAWVGLDDAAKGTGSIKFMVYADGVLVYDSGVMKKGMPPKEVDIPLSGTQALLLKVGDANDGHQYDHANWGEARFEVVGTDPVTIGVPKEKPYLLTPMPGPEPRLNNAKIYGCRPDNPFLYRIPATGSRPMEFAAEGLPPSLKLNLSSGIITGTAPPRGETKVILQATNSSGKDSREFRIVSGDKLALTPYMGWNHWYAHYDRITDEMMREAADIMDSSGMADHGYSYVSIDDCWMRKPGSDNPEIGGDPRDDTGRILTNARFPDMKALTDYIHAKGLKAGTYTSPGPLTCTEFEGAYEHEAIDAQQFAEWGFDLLKYDWCSYGSKVVGKKPSLEEMEKPYRLMGGILKEQKRDIVYNLCQYGMGDVWEWGAEVGAHSWRTAGDLGFSLDSIFEVARQNARIGKWNVPGEWNDPDYIQIGYVGKAHGLGQPEPSQLTPTEQYAFMSLWSLMASPLMFSGDMAKLDEFTLNVLCNREVIEINQDPLGKCGKLVEINDDSFLLIKELEDGSNAIGLCNGGEMETELSVRWSDVGLTGKQRVRDVWRHKDLGEFADAYKAKVPRRGVAFIKVSGLE